MASDVGHNLGWENTGQWEALFNAYLDGDLSDEDRAHFDRQLAANSDFRHAYDAFADIVGGLRRLPFEFAPDDFVEGVQTRIRKRSQGRFFADYLLTNRTHVPYEVVAIVMILVMAAAYFAMGIPKDRHMQDVDKPAIAAPHTPKALSSPQTSAPIKPAPPAGHR